MDPRPGPCRKAPGDIVGVGIHTGNALRGYELGVLARARGATVIFGGVHATLYPDEALSLGGAHAVVKATATSPGQSCLKPQSAACCSQSMRRGA